MRITMIGTGYVGLVSGVCFSEFGHIVTCVDKDQSKIDMLNQGGVPIYEPGLERMVQNNMDHGRLRFSTDLASSLRGVNAVFIAVGTPNHIDGGAIDLSYVYTAAEEIAKHLDGYTVVVVKSTVPVGTSEKVAAIIRKINPRVDFDVVSNPEFLREGSAIVDFTRPDRLIIGAKGSRATEVMRTIYAPLLLNETPVLYTTPQTAELIKYAANAFLAAKITFINEMADLCEATGANVGEVAKAMGMDTRISPKFLNAGPGYGGSCFPKDTRALKDLATQLGVELPIVSAAIVANDRRKVRMADKIVKACGGSVEGKTIAMLGLAFKANTDDMREAPSLVIIPELQKAGAQLRVFDPKAMTTAEKVLQDIYWAQDSYDAVTGADCMVIMTEWNEFQVLDFTQIRELMKTHLVVDLRNIYKPEELREAGFDYYSIGREPVVVSSPALMKVAG